jgi:cysteine-S-conjugate beta-lyase
MFDFDEVIDRRGTHCIKWDMMQPLYGVAPDDGLAMWVADMDFRPPPSVTAALAAEVEHGVHGYFGDDRAHKAAIAGWMSARHGWEVDPAAIATTHGVVAGLALCLQAFTEPGDGVILFSPVYHAFFRVLRANGRAIVESPLVQRDDGRYAMDLEALAAALTGRERMVVLCSPHNPGGRVWTRDELRALADFCAAHDLLLVADEIHHDLVLGAEPHLPMPLAAPEISSRLIMLTAATKTFNLAGALTGNVIIAEPSLRSRFAAAHLAAGTGANRFGVLAVTAAYAGGAAWVDALRGYLAGNAALFIEGVGAIPGLRPMPLDSTYLAWVDFAGTGMAPAEFTARVERDARIAPSHGASFGTGGESFLRFNIATPRSRVAEAVRRLRAAFADLQ